MKKSDPYCLLESRGQRFQTITQHATQFPVWGETFEFRNIQATDELTISVWDYDRISKHECVRAGVALRTAFYLHHLSCVFLTAAFFSSLARSAHSFMGEIKLRQADFVQGQKWYTLQPRVGQRDRVAGELLVKIVFAYH